MSDLISRQMAIDAVLELRDCPNGYSDAYDKSEIIALLEEVPSAQQNTCEYWDGESNFCALCRPFAQPEQKHGRWIKLYHGNYKCSECGDWWGNDDNEMVEDFKFCPNCGARMEE